MAHVVVKKRPFGRSVAISPGVCAQLRVSKFTAAARYLEYNNSHAGLLCPGVNKFPCRSRGSFGGARKTCTAKVPLIQSCKCGISPRCRNLHTHIHDRTDPHPLPLLLRRFYHRAACACHVSGEILFIRCILRRAAG